MIFEFLIPFKQSTPLAMFTSNQRGYIFTNKHGKSLKVKWNVLWAFILWASGCHQRASIVKCWSIRERWVATECWHSIRETHCFGLDLFAKTPCYYILKGRYTEQPFANPAIMIPAYMTESQTAFVLRLYSEDEVFGGWGWGAAGEEQLWRQYSLSAVVHWCSFCWGSANLDFNFKFKIKTPL